MMDDQLVEVDAVGFKVARRFNLRRGSEGTLPENWAPMSHVGHQMPAATCSPTWAQPSVDGSRIYVACNRADTIVEIDRDRWVVTRRFATGRGPYNLAVTPDGKYLVASLKQGSSMQLFDLVTALLAYRHVSPQGPTAIGASATSARASFCSARSR